MPLPTSRSELLDEIEGNFAKLFKDLETVPATRCHETTMEGHAKETMMSVHNLVSYLVGWNHLVLKRIVTFISSQTDDRLYGVNWCEKYTLGRMIQFNTSSPYSNAHTPSQSRP